MNALCVVDGTIEFVRTLLCFDPDVFYSPRYVQRLAAPTGEPSGHAFGAGGRTGGMDEVVLDRWLEVWDFEYMGASEYEHGASGAALERIATGMSIGTYDAWSFPLTLRANKRLGLEAGDSPVAIYAIGRMAHRVSIERTITDWANWPNREFIQLKGPALVSQVLRCDGDPNDGRADTRGWLELTNGFLFFADEQMYHRALAHLLA